ncbi:MAG: DUF1957 domain-containing protein [Gemmatimonadetes bacterium]|nr:DUF1957 domain-containing protein [Gemmatimonadota bacterium]
MTPVMDFVLVLHSHLPYVLNHGRWPHGSDWLCEAALDTYLPLVHALDALEKDGVHAPITLGITPILASQLANPVFNAELELFLAQRLDACIECEGALPNTADERLIEITRWWYDRYTWLRDIWESINGDLVGTFARHARAGRLEITTSAATHGFLPLLGRDESIRFQLAAGANEHERLFGSRAAGLWMPECAYRPRGVWNPDPQAPRAGVNRAGIETFLEEYNVRFVTVDAHLARAGQSLGLYGEVAMTTGELLKQGVIVDSGRRRHSPYRAYRIGRRRDARAPRALVRDPRTSFKVWSRHDGYPGDGAYLEFHKIRYPGGLKLWRVTNSHAELGQKRPYRPDAAQATVKRHAKDFAATLAGIARNGDDPLRDVVVAPFDTELFGHWWAEGVDFIEGLYRALPAHGEIRATTASQHIARARHEGAVQLAAGSWGANGDFSMWYGPETAWTWHRLWPIEERFWAVAPRAIGDADRQELLAQAARSMLLLMSSDWQFIISTGEVADYAERRFIGHAEDCARLLDALEAPAGTDLTGARELAAELRARDDVFPTVLDAVRDALARSAPLEAAG